MSPMILPAKRRRERMNVREVELRSLQLESGGFLMACGELWNVKAKSLGAGVYQVSLQLRTPK